MDIENKEGGKTMKMNPVFIIASLMLTLLSCDNRREILEDETLWVKVKMDWSQAEIQPNGATVWFFPQNQPGGSPVVMRTHAASDSLRLRRGVYSVLMFNDTEDDHTGMRFRGTDRYETFEAYNEYVKQKGTVATIAGEPLAVIPDPLALYCIDQFTVQDKTVASTGYLEMKLTPVNRLYTLQFSAHIIGLDNVIPASSYATINGIAGGAYLTRNRQNDERVTHQFGFERRTWDPGSYQNGKLYCSFLFFGVSGEWIGQVLDTRVTLHFKLRDGSDFTLERNVSQLIRQEGTSKLLILDIGTGNTEQDAEIRVPDVPDLDPGADSGFDADVDDWGDETIIEVPTI